MYSTPRTILTIHVETYITLLTLPELISRTFCGQQISWATSNTLYLFFTAAAEIPA
jgi:hypothetical protein